MSELSEKPKPTLEERAEYWQAECARIQELYVEERLRNFFLRQDLKRSLLGLRAQIDACLRELGGPDPEEKPKSELAL